MVKDNRRIAPPSNCISPNSFKSLKKVETVVKDDGFRFEGRKFEDLRPLSLKFGLVPSVTGSAYLECGDTKVIASVNGPRDVLHKSDSVSKGQVFCEFKYAMFSSKERQPYVPTDEEISISKAIQDALEPVILLHKFPKARLDISIIVLEDDGGALSAAITCAGAALSNAGVEMFDLPVGCTLVYDGQHVLIDPTASEEAFRRSSEYAKITIGMMAAYNHQIIFMDSVGSLKPELFSKALKTLQSKCHITLTYIKDCLKQHLRNSSELDSQSSNEDVISKVDYKVVEMRLFQPQKYMSIHLENGIRPDGREVNEFRPVLISVGAIGTACGSALIRMNKTCVLCGIKADLTNPTQDEPNKGFIVPNVTLTPVCSNKFQPGPPTEQAQAYSQMIMNLIKNSNFLDPSVLCIAEGKLAWCLFVEMICISYDGNVLDACILALMAALRNTKLPEVNVDSEDNNVEVTDKLMSLNVDYFVFPATFAILKDGAVADPSAEEESLANGTLTVFLKGDGSSSIQSFGSMKEEQIFNCIECSKVRYEEMKKLLDAFN